MLYHVPATSLLLFDGTIKYIAPDAAALIEIASCPDIRLGYTYNSNGPEGGGTELVPIKPTWLPTVVKYTQNSIVKLLVPNETPGDIVKY